MREPPALHVLASLTSSSSVAAFLANQGRRVSVVFEKADAVIASKTPVPEFIRKSRYVFPCCYCGGPAHSVSMTA